MINRFIPLILVSLLAILTLLTACSSVSDHEDGHDNSLVVFVPKDDPMGEVQSTLDLAKQNNKLALIILGAQWCHDSIGLVKQFQTPKMKRILGEHYETTFIDVGFFQDHRAITQRFKQAHYFATPTVLIVDPVSEQLLNSETLQKWGAADSVSKRDYIRYFEGFQADNISLPQPILEQHQTTISGFEQAQSSRLMAAYLVLSPELKADVNRPKGTDYDPNFLVRWKEVRTFRLKLQKDIQALYAQARAQPNTALTVPRYAAFSWE